MAIEYDQLGNVIQGSLGDLPPIPSKVMPAIGERIVPGVPEGAEPEMPEMPQVNFQDINGNLSKDDFVDGIWIESR